MKEYFFNCGTEITPLDLQRLREQLKDMEVNDRIVIRLEGADATQSEGIVEELERQGFDFQPHGGHEREYYYTAIKIK
ncbi:hypothetical protein [Anaerobranca gottschalkii]|uniref:TusA-related sulfurtransferase n=1 Tax=Anaerobranca gottschalkii DSM 13577 TaxID=1120990 RepID=A0A1H9YMX1_9FIRM|nr:hypothetical protein [Anaerobranca gottschalkii]SES70332.1 hypothetical protein SAMN03080614_100414 [Anaerobranca gottschalkii DSM 13577]